MENPMVEAENAQAEATQKTTPRKYRVVMINDDYTPMEFVVMVLIKIFGHDLQRASDIMLQVHERGRGVCGVYSREMAETKAALAMRIAAENEFPFQCVVEPEE